MPQPKSLGGKCESNSLLLQQVQTKCSLVSSDLQLSESHTYMNVLSKLPDYLGQTGFQDPSDAFDGLFQHVIGTKSHYFESFNSRPGDQTASDTVMAISRKDRGEERFEFYPVKERLRVAGEKPLLVDVGGGLGNDLIALKAKITYIPGKLVVQDLPIVIDHVKDLPPGIEAMKHDLFSPQPFKDAKAHYFRTVLHDWPDKQGRQRLTNIKTARNKDKDSVLLINENISPETKVPLYPTMLDLSMMALFSSPDRTQSHFQELLNFAGFKLLKFWTPRLVVPGSGTLFEATLQE